MDSIPLSIIIPLSKDWRIINCLDSIDCKVEVIVILNGKYDKLLEKELRKRDIKIIKMNNFSFSKFYNLGIANASYNKIFFMDSDCIFRKGKIKEMYVLSKKYPIVKYSIKFNYDDLISKIVARAREFTTSDKPNLFIPGAIFDKTVFKRIGLFNEKITHSADAEMQNRIIRSNIKWIHRKEIIIEHKPTRFAEDLRSGFNYGTGRAEKHILESRRIKFEIVKEIMDFLLSGIKEKGLITGLYLFIWKITFSTGYLIKLKEHKNE